MVVYDTAHSYPVTAGVGPFNASYISPFFNYLSDLAPDYQFKVLPYSYYGGVHNLITNPFYTTTTEPVLCQPDGHDDTGHCASYLLSGGVVGTTPWIPTGYPDHPQVLVDKAPVIHVEFRALPTDMKFDNKSCQVIGSNSTTIAAKLCLERGESRAKDGQSNTIHAGMACLGEVNHQVGKADSAACE